MELERKRHLNWVFPRGKRLLLVSLILLTGLLTYPVRNGITRWGIVVGVVGADAGLMRAALVNAHGWEALRTANPGLAREALWLWWNDCSAAGMSEGYDGRTVRLGTMAVMREIPAEELKAGDLGVTADGSHVLAYLGGGEWIEADPFLLRVIRVEPGGNSPWLNSRVVHCRWRCITEESAAPK